MDQNLLKTATHSPLAVDRNLIKIFTGIIVCLIFANVLFIAIADRLDFLERPWTFIVYQIDLNIEGNFATWCSSMLLFYNFILAYMLAFTFRSMNRQKTIVNGLIAAGFLLLSIDDISQIHERFEEFIIGNNFGEQTESLNSLRNI